MACAYRRDNLPDDYIISVAHSALRSIIFATLGSICVGMENGKETQAESRSRELKEYVARLMVSTKVCDGFDNNIM
jgi:hypothetical protein